MLLSMSERHKILLPRAAIKDNGMSPSNLELFDLMHITSCEIAIKAWQPDWAFCPVCLQLIDEDGLCIHRAREDFVI